MTDEKLIKRVILHEGMVLKPYKCPAGKLTIGVGRNLEDIGISQDEALFLLENDLNRCHQECLRSFFWYKDLDTDRQGVIQEMCFNLGLARLKTFKKMLRACEVGNYELAAHEMLSSRWSAQVGKRAETLADIMKGKTTCYG